MVNLDTGLALREKYLAADPFPHIVIDDFLPPAFHYHLVESIEQIGEHAWDGEEHAHSKLKSFISSPLMMPARVCAIASYVNSEAMCRFLSDLSGIPDVLADRNFVGGGLHRIKQGGKLGIHADFNVHPQTGLHRRLNLLLYLNPIWEDSWEGFLELWARDKSRCVQRIKPVFNRAVIFTITDDALHGHPTPLVGKQRYSFAAYYYTKDRPAHEKSPAHMATWHETPSS